MSTRTTALLAAVLAVPAFANPGPTPDPNNVPDIPKQAEVHARVKKILDQSPEDTLEVAGVAKLVYKRIPMDVKAVALQFGGTLTGKESPKGIPLERYVKQFEPQVQQAIDAYLLDVGSIEVLAPLELKGKEIASGKLRFGVAVQGGKPIGIQLRGDTLPKKKPLLMKLKKHKSEEQEAPEKDSMLRLRLVQPDPQVAGQEKFEILARLVGADVVTGDSLARPAPEGEKKGEKADKDDEAAGDEDKKEK